MPPSKIQAEARERIRALYPGDKFKSLRNKLYSTPGFLEDNPTDEMIREAAGVNSDEETSEDPPKEGQIIEEGKVYKVVTSLKADYPSIIKTQEDYAQADKVFSSIKKMLTELEAERVSMTKPLLDTKKKIDEKYKASADILNAKLDPVEAAMRAFKALELAEIRKQEEERQSIIKETQEKAQREADEARAKLEAAHKAEEAEEDPFLAELLAEDIAKAQAETRTALVSLATVQTRVVLPDAVVPTVAAGSKTTVAWTYIITNENLVPRAYCSPDNKKINALVKMLKEASGGDITKLNQDAYPGLQIFEDIRIGSR